MFDQAWQRYDGWTNQDGTITVECSTNDNLDRGYASEDAHWTLRKISKEFFESHCRKSRIGISGIEVTVRLDGKQI